VLRLLIDTSVWLDMAKHRDGQKLIVPLRVLYFQKRLRLAVPALVIDEFERNRPRVEASVTASVTERVRLLKQDLSEYGGEDRSRWLEEMTHRLPLLSALSLQNFKEIRELLGHPTSLKPTGRQQAAAVERALTKKAPFHLSKNSVADALLVEMFSSVLARSSPGDVCGFATSNYQDFSFPNGDRRKPHPDLQPIFADNRARFAHGTAGLTALLEEHFGEAFAELVDELDFVGEEPRTLVEILEAEQEFFDKVWYVRTLIRQEKEQSGQGPPLPDGLAEQVTTAMRRIENKYGAALTPKQREALLEQVKAHVTAELGVAPIETNRPPSALVQESVPGQLPSRRCHPRPETDLSRTS
jgi:hypothetical protein